MTSKSPNHPLNVCILIRKLDTGGAERQALELAKGLPRDRFKPAILTFYPGGDFEAEAKGAGIEVICLNKQGRWDLMSFQWRLVSLLRRLKTDIIHAFESPPSLLAQISRPFVPGLKVIWGVRTSNMNLGDYDYSRQLVFQIVRRFSSRADLIICNSKAGAEYFQSKGFPDTALRVVANGIDHQRFSPNPEARRKVRAELGVGDSSSLVGIAARLDPVKNHDTFLQAAAIFLKGGADARFVCVGDGPERNYLEDRCRALGIEDQVIWLGSRQDMPDIYNSLDANTLTSVSGEGFPNTIGEAMSCGTPCVTTDVGDAANIVQGTGHVAPVRGTAEIAEGWGKLCFVESETRQKLREKCQRRIENDYSIDRMVAGNAALYEKLVTDT
jgi:glycosyltransferase involved in cell wall biosynthesis